MVRGRECSIRRALVDEQHGFGAANLVALNPDVIVVVGDRVIPILTISGPHRGPARKKEGSGPSMRGDQLIDRGAIITGEYWVCMRPELGEFIQ